ncbi:DUF1906 domain-containing protein [Desulfosporosinus sp. PR]|uniref:DUF1906 domain-containing protein n=1 Tax=Candidatus Desulfosporosinus nitrosoreducens TaxID=3401928 RepID=UPI0027F3A827|nr:DUF1906 domain-containing protein [Desulfosporosinus sp. PR]MDQ7095014.1 DUF1906 domain-containing protein [Desulfosporosinus sp. PR]
MRNQVNPGKHTGPKSAGVKAVGRYLGGNYGLTVAEVKAIHDAGLLLWLILELSPTKASYFNYLRGVSDAQYALAEAQALGAPKGVCIYFTVDCDAQPGDMTAIQEYFRGIHTVLTGKYLVGAYGSYAVMLALQKADYPPDRYFQTYAWSGGQTAPNHIYQYQNDTSLAGIAVDRDYVNEDAGLWKGSVDVLEVAVLLYTKEDYWAGTDVSVKNGNCALFIRPDDHSVPKDAMSAEKLIVVGGQRPIIPMKCCYQEIRSTIQLRRSRSIWDRESLHVKIINDPIPFVIKAFEELFPGLEANIQIASDIEGAGCTTIPEDESTPLVDISMNIPISAMPEILVHELAHVAKPNDEHGEEWKETFHLIFN